MRVLPVPFVRGRCSLLFGADVPLMPFVTGAEVASNGLSMFSTERPSKRGKRPWDWWKSLWTVYGLVL